MLRSRLRFQRTAPRLRTFSKHDDRCEQNMTENWLLSISKSKLVCLHSKSKLVCTAPRRVECGATRLEAASEIGRAPASSAALKRLHIPAWGHGACPPSTYLELTISHATSTRTPMGTHKASPATSTAHEKKNTKCPMQRSRLRLLRRCPPDRPVERHTRAALIDGVQGTGPDHERRSSGAWHGGA